jgi:hypothetical protein
LLDQLDSADVEDLPRDAGGAQRRSFRFDHRSIKSNHWRYHWVMKAKLTPIGDEHGLVIDRKILELLKISPDTELEVSTDAGCLIIEPAKGAPRLKRRERSDRERTPLPRPLPIPRPLPRHRRPATIRLPKKQPW